MRYEYLFSDYVAWVHMEEVVKAYASDGWRLHTIAKARLVFEREIIEEAAVLVETKKSVNLRQLIQAIVNAHTAQTGLPTVSGEVVRDLVVDILGDMTDNDYILLEHMTQGDLRAGPIEVKGD